MRDVRELVFALDADIAGQQQWYQLARQAALRGKRGPCCHLKHTEARKTRAPHGRWGY